MRFHVRGRSDQMLVFKGVNFFPQSLMSVVAEFPEELGSAYRVVRPPAGPADYIDVVMETSVAAPARTRLAAAIERRISSLLQVRTRVHLVAAGSLPQDLNKSRYLVESLADVPGAHLGTPVEA
jgi:phenylacetate-CoA ligase